MSRHMGPMQPNKRSCTKKSLQLAETLQFQRGREFRENVLNSCANKGVSENHILPYAWAYQKALELQYLSGEEGVGNFIKYWGMFPFDLVEWGRLEMTQSQKLSFILKKFCLFNTLSHGIHAWSVVLNLTGIYLFCPSSYSKLLPWSSVVRKGKNKVCFFALSLSAIL